MPMLVRVRYARGLCVSAHARWHGFFVQIIRHFFASSFLFFQYHPPAHHGHFPLLYLLLPSRLSLHHNPSSCTSSSFRSPSFSTTSNPPLHVPPPLLRNLHLPTGSHGANFFVPWHGAPPPPSGAPATSFLI